MRESVFACLGDLTGCSFLDLFSGSGIIALEAASRGADPVEAVEIDPLKRAVLLANVSIARIRIQCRFMPTELYVQRAKTGFDIIFCDPPFKYPFKADLMQRIAGSTLMKPESLVLLHRHHRDPVEGRPLIRRESREYGRSVVDFFVFNPDTTREKEFV
jgi:16S rRNA (guanine(966)-N(2))-methyltransferase RsmD